MILFEVFAHIMFWLVMIVGVAIIPLSLPGTFLIVANSFVYGWISGFSELTICFLVILLAIAIFVEALEFFIGAAVAGKYGASKQGMFGAILGSIVGAIWMMPILPFIGPLIGAFVGAFVGATLFEYIKSSDWEKAIAIGFAAFLGQLGGVLTKMTAAIAMIVLVITRIY